MAIPQIIFDYLQNNRRLTIPEFGTLLSRGEGQPLLFSEFMKSDDGVLRGLLIEQGSSECEAEALVGRFVELLKRGVAVSGYFDASPLGRFVASSDGVGYQLVSAEVEEQKVEPQPQKAVPSNRTAKPRTRVAKQAPSPKRGVDIWMMVVIAAILLALFAVCYGLVTEWRMGHLSFGEGIDNLLYQIFGM